MPVEYHAPDLVDVLARAGVVVVHPPTGPDRFLIELNPLVARPPVHHRAKPAITHCMSLDTLDGRLLVPQRHPLSIDFDQRLLSAMRTIVTNTRASPTCLYDHT